MSDQTDDPAPVAQAVSAIDGVVPEVRSPATEVYRDRARAMPWLGALFGLAAVLLVPWTVFLGVALPQRHTTSHYDLAWAGFDVGLLLALATTAYAVLRRSPWVGTVAGVAAALLVTDAWFDVVTASTGGDRVAAVAMAVLVELPMAAVAVWLCGHADRLADRRLRILLGRTRRARRAGTDG